MEPDKVFPPSTGWIHPTYDQVYLGNNLEQTYQQLDARTNPDRETCEKIMLRFGAVGMIETAEPVSEYFPRFTVPAGGNPNDLAQREPMTHRAIVFEQGATLYDPVYWGSADKGEDPEAIERKVVGKVRARFQIDSRTLVEPFETHKPEEAFPGGLFYGTDGNATRFNSLAEQESWRALIKAEEEAYNLLMTPPPA